MNLLVTGGAGFIGSNFVRYWRSRYPHDKITVLDKLTYAGRRENLTDVPDVTFIQGDICDAGTVSKALSGIDTIVHFAAESHVDRSLAEPAVFLQTNVVGTQVLLDAARMQGVTRFHHISTDEVFGQILPGGTPFTEATPYNPRSPYAASKAASDHLVRAYHASYGLPVTITNCSNNFGPYHHPEKFIPRAITLLLQGKRIPIYTPGNQVRDWLYVEDHCRAIEAVLMRGTVGETYCVGGMTEDVTNIEVARMLLDILGAGEDRVEYVPDRPGHDLKYAVDWSKIRRELGWEPERSFAERLKETVLWYQTHQSWWKPLVEESEAFYATKTKTHL